jgi:putative ABC transport system permease protein
MEGRGKATGSQLVFNLLRWMCPSHLYEEIEGDLLQCYSRDTAKHGASWAEKRLIWNVVRFLRPGIILRNKFSISLNGNFMLRNYIKIAFRSFRKEKIYTVLNVIGLSLGMAASLLIIQYVKYERSFDGFHSRAKDIYRIQYNGWHNGQLTFESAVAVPASAAALKANFPEVEEFTRFLPAQRTVSYDRPGEEPITFREEGGQFADTSIFKVFDSFKLAKGDQKTCLKGLNKIIVSESMARKYFGDGEPIGKRLKVGDLLMDISGVFQDIPENSHIKFDFLISYETLNADTKNESETSWGWYDFYSFVMLKPGTDVRALQAKWDKWLVKNRGEAWEKYKERQEFILRPLTDIHLQSNLLYETSPGDLRDGDSVYALQIIAVFLLIIAWVNYVNLATARSFNRANEVGVRKVVGAFRGQLIGQFLTESFILNVCAAALAIGLVRLSWPSFSQLTGWHIPLEFMLQPDFWWLVVSLFLLGAVLSGFYPAVILSSFRPVAVLKGKIIRSSGGNYLRTGLVIFQFVASLILISGSLIVFQQLDYMKNKDLGVDLNKTLVIKGPNSVDSLYLNKYAAFKTELLRISGVKGISASSSIPGEENYWTSGIRRVDKGFEGRITVTHMALDYEYVPQYGIKVVAGRNFDRRFPRDVKNVMINESLVKDLGFPDAGSAVGEKLVQGMQGRDTLEIVGVLQDYHQMSLRTKVIPVAFRLRDVTTFYSIKLETDNYKAVIESIEGPWKTFFPGNPIDYFFLDQFFNRQYDRDDRFSQVFTLFTILAIFIASLGLLGLASFMAVQRTREIGIRKVMGSSVSGVILLLSQKFMRPVLLAILIACPLGWWLMSRWLQSFPYHTTISAWTFLGSGMLVTAIAFVSVSSQTLKAAMTKPAETLKYE